MAFIDEDIMACLRRRGRRWPVSVAVLAEKTGHSPTDTYVYVDYLRGKGLIEQDAAGQVRLASPRGSTGHAAG